MLSDRGCDLIPSKASQMPQGGLEGRKFMRSWAARQNCLERYWTSSAIMDIDQRVGTSRNPILGTNPALQHL